ncbi:cation:proton antiporter domain-containing protein [Streptomyces sp. SDT5-1]|uniref:cation:proton antiporter domain-containing protein n=1 Tax=Streptomyces sp. SDT5-1 TaxID=3406418 RepID=UPI003FD204BF
MGGRPAPPSGGPARLSPAIRGLLLAPALMAIGWAVARFGDVEDISGSDGFLALATILLAVGLYGSTYGVSRSDVRDELPTVLTAVTVGVVCKAALIAGALWWVVPDPSYVLLAVVMAQIDPLAVSALLDRSRLSQRGRAVLAIWASFDDPVTVLLAAYVARFALAGQSGSPVRTTAGAYAVELAANAALVAVALAAHRGLRTARRTWPGAERRVHVAEVALLLGFLAAAVRWSLLLGLAAVGLFYRPRLGAWLERAVRGAFVAAAVSLGLLLVLGVDPLRGLVLGVAAFAAQGVVGWFVARRLEHMDRVLLACQQQNGITAIILALMLEPDLPRTVAIVGPAIVVVNALHFTAHTWWFPRYARRRADAEGGQRHGV